MTMRLHLLCVASTSSIRSASFPSNDPLDAQGRKALEAFAGSRPLFDKTWTSPPDVSAVQTAEILGLCRRSTRCCAIAILAAGRDLRATA